MVVSEVVSDSVESVVVNEIDKAVQPLKNKIAELEVQLAHAKTHANTPGVVMFESMVYARRKVKIVMLWRISVETTSNVILL